MRVVFGSVLAFLVAAIVVYAAVVAGAFGYMEAYGVFDRDGGLSMAIMFAIGPLCALLAGTIAAIVAGIRLGRRERARARGQLPPARPWPLPVQLAGALCAGAATYGCLWAVLWTVGPLRFDSYGPALAVSLMPIALAAVVVGLMAWRALRRRRVNPT